MSAVSLYPPPTHHRRSGFITRRGPEKALTPTPVCTRLVLSLLPTSAWLPAPARAGPERALTRVSSRT